MLKSGILIRGPPTSKGDLLSFYSRAGRGVCCSPRPKRRSGRVWFNADACKASDRHTLRSERRSVGSNPTFSAILRLFWPFLKEKLRLQANRPYIL